MDPECPIERPARERARCALVTIDPSAESAEQLASRERRAREGGGPSTSSSTYGPYVIWG